MGVYSAAVDPDLRTRSAYTHGRLCRVAPSCRPSLFCVVSSSTSASLLAHCCCECVPWLSVPSFRPPSEQRRLSCKQQQCQQCRPGRPHHRRRQAFALFPTTFSRPSSPGRPTSRSLTLSTSVLRIEEHWFWTRLIMPLPLLFLTALLSSLCRKSVTRLPVSCTPTSQIGDTPL